MASTSQSSVSNDWRKHWSTQEYGEWPHPGPPTLIIVMGVSGSGKSTLGSSLSHAMNLPFIDGDDLHPSSNVAKMSAGTPLTDADRLPWLQKIRSTALDVLCRGQGHAHHRTVGDTPTKEEVAKRKLAEAMETSADAHREYEHLDAKDVAEGAKKEAELQHVQPSTASTDGGDADSPSTRPPAILIACSALKVSYRDLLRGAGNASHDPLRTLHLYVKIPHEELRRRIHDRKGHWMKEEMLNSQLATLEEPSEESGEEGIIVEPEIGKGMEELVQRCVSRVKKELGQN